VVPQGAELRLLDIVDRLWNLCVERGGWEIRAVLAMSAAPIGVTADESCRLIPNRGYLEECAVVTSAHPKNLAGAGNQAADVDRREMASKVLKDVVKWIAMAGGAEQGESLEFWVEELYTKVYRESRFFSFPDLSPFRVFPYAWFQNQAYDGLSAQEAATEIARANGK
jgi:hypothetical protein